MILPIYTYGNPVLRKEAQDIDASYPELQTLIANMYETLKESDGIGLAAPETVELCWKLNQEGFDLPLDKLDPKECAQALYDMVIA